ncbi:MAG: hypothetical protein NC548_40065 [Lachnospiraceae bacterium]|nr:hypothetical protein [Lachnospiraceae bacterium]MCM1230869.1 hypothetical protein [Ruminococcus flavefaciens]
MNNREKIQNKIETGDFMHRNGSILRTLNVISDSRCRLSSLEYSFKRVDHYEFMDSIKYLNSSGYVELTDSENEKKTDFKADRFDSTEISLTAKGIQVLRGAITDGCIDV